MRADNEMSGGGMASGEGGRPPTVIIIIISKWAKPPAGSQQERLYFYLSPERGRREGATRERGELALCQSLTFHILTEMILTTAVEETRKRFCLLETFFHPVY